MIIKTLEEISETDISCGPEATSLLKNICDFQFVFCLVFLKDVMTHTNILSKYLQYINMNYAAVISMSTQTINIFKEMRSDKKFDDMWDKVIEMAIENNIEHAQLPRKKIPMRFGGGEHQPQEIQIKDYYRINIYFAVLYIIVKEIIDQFQENELEILDGLINVFTNENPDEKLLDIVCKTYKFDNHELQVELKIFNRIFKSKQINSNNSLLYCVM